MGFAVTAPLASSSFSATITTTTCQLDPVSNKYSVEPGYYCQFFNGIGIIDIAKTLCPKGKYCLGGNDGPDGDCEAGYYCPEGSTSPLGESVDSFKFTDTKGEKYTACFAGRVCRCDEGYWCPKGSTTPRGQPVQKFNSTKLALSNAQAAGKRLLRQFDMDCKYIEPCLVLCIEYSSLFLFSYSTFLSTIHRQATNTY